MEGAVFIACEDCELKKEEYKKNTRFPHKEI